MTYVNTFLQTPAPINTVLVKEHVPRTHQILQQDTYVNVISDIQETTVKMVGRIKYFDKDVKDSSYNIL